MLAGYMDFCMGVFLCVMISRMIFHTTPTFLCMFLCAVAALIPDFDIVWPIIIGQNPVGDHHQWLTHRPGFIVPVTATVGYLLAGKRGVWLAGTCVLWHLFHDTKGVLDGGGIAWLWPWSQKYWGFTGGADPETIRGTGITWMDINWNRLSNVGIAEVFLGTVAFVIAGYVRGRVYFAFAWAVIACVLICAIISWYPDLLHRRSFIYRFAMMAFLYVSR